MDVVVRWLDRLEGRCGPVPAWGLAVALVVTGLPAVLVWRLMVESRRAAASPRKKMTPGAHPLPGHRRGRGGAGIGSGGWIAGWPPGLPFLHGRGCRAPGAAAALETWRPPERR
jgi:hypothetical protein